MWGALGSSSISRRTGDDVAACRSTLERVLCFGTRSHRQADTAPLLRYTLCASILTARAPSRYACVHGTLYDSRHSRYYTLLPQVYRALVRTAPTLRVPSNDTVLRSRRDVREGVASLWSCSGIRASPCLGKVWCACRRARHLLSLQFVVRKWWLHRNTVRCEAFSV